MPTASYPCDCDKDRDNVVIEHRNRRKEWLQLMCPWILRQEEEHRPPSRTPDSSPECANPRKPSLRCATSIWKTKVKVLGVRHVQGHHVRRCRRHLQGQGVSGRYETPRLPKEAAPPTFQVPPRHRWYGDVIHTGAHLQGAPDGRAHGNRPCDRPEPSCRSGSTRRCRSCW